MLRASLRPEALCLKSPQKVQMCSTLGIMNQFYPCMDPALIPLTVFVPLKKTKIFGTENQSSRKLLLLEAAAQTRMFSDTTARTQAHFKPVEVTHKSGSRATPSSRGLVV